MTSSDSEDFKDLSGPWTGVYDYPESAHDPVSFSAILKDVDGNISGEIIEPNTMSQDAGKFLYANVSGTLSGSHLKFMKFYEDFDNDIHEVIYEGTVDKSLTRIEGMWTTIEEDPWSGPFVMNRIRAKKVQKTAEEEVTERL